MKSSLSLVSGCLPDPRGLSRTKGQAALSAGVGAAQLFLPPSLAHQTHTHTVAPTQASRFVSHSVVSDSVTPKDCSLPGSCPGNSPGKDTAVGCHFLLRGIFLTQGSNLALSTCFHEPPGCRQQVMGLLSLQNQMSQSCTINLCILCQCVLLVLILWRTPIQIQT